MILSYHISFYFCVDGTVLDIVEIALIIYSKSSLELSLSPLLICKLETISRIHHRYTQAIWSVEMLLFD